MGVSISERIANAQSVTANFNDNDKASLQKIKRSKIKKKYNSSSCFPKKSSGSSAESLLQGKTREGS